jgi:hypothetical protein
VRGLFGEHRISSLLFNFSQVSKSQLWSVSDHATRPDRRSPERRPHFPADSSKNSKNHVVRTEGRLSLLRKCGFWIRSRSVLSPLHIQPTAYRVLCTVYCVLLPRAAQPFPQRCATISTLAAVPLKPQACAAKAPKMTTFLKNTFCPGSHSELRIPTFPLKPQVSSPRSAHPDRLPDVYFFRECANNLSIRTMSRVDKAS